MTIAGFSKVAIIGAGQMGHGIAQVCASSVLMLNLSISTRASLEKAQANISKSLEKMEARVVCKKAKQRIAYWLI